MEVALLIKHKTDVRGLPDKMGAVAMGKMPHAGPVLVALYQQILQIPSQDALNGND